MSTLQIRQIRTDGGTQSRAAIRDDVVEDYATRNGELPKIVVFYDGSNYWLSDGFHRVAGRKKAGKPDIEADILQGTLRDAILFSVQANATHGLPRSNDDKRRAVALLLADEEWSKCSDRWIAEHCRVSHDLVAYVRSGSTGDSASSNSSRTGKDGKSRTSTSKVLCSKCKRLTHPVKDCQNCKDARDVSREEKEKEKSGKEAARAAKQKAKEEREAAAASEKAERERVKAEKKAAKEKEAADKAAAKVTKEAAKNTTASDADETVMTDAEGETVPEQAREAFLRADDLTKICRELDDIRKRIETIASGPGGRLLRFEDIKQKLLDTKGNIWANRATHVCGYCHGKDKKCVACKGEGWTSKLYWTATPGNDPKAK